MAEHLYLGTSTAYGKSCGGEIPVNSLTSVGHADATELGISASQRPNTGAGAGRGGVRQTAPTRSHGEVQNVQQNAAQGEARMYVGNFQCGG